VSYEDAIAAEQKIYENNVAIHDLPPIFHYWSNRYLLPKLQSCGFNSQNEMFLTHLEKACLGATPHFVSLGAGNCDLELELAQALKAKGHDFTLDCLELNPTMLERGRLAAETANLSCHLNFSATDLNAWNATEEYDAVIAIQSLHHVVNLEGLFDQVKRSLRPGGSFLISDMIGRNGHQRWPEALEIVHEFWRKLPPSYRFNKLLNRYEELYESWDCSVEGFEGVRSQDILPLLLERFHFQFFFPFGNAIDPFVDRAFGPHFDPAAEWDRSFIDAVHQRDHDEIAAGRLKPTHLLAVLGHEPFAAPTFPGNLSPQSCVRPADRLVPPSTSESPSPYDWSWPHDPRKELEIACQRLVEKRTASVLDQKQPLEALEREFEERTSWAIRLENELADQTARVEQLEREQHKLIHNPLHLARRLLTGIRNRLFS